MTTEAIDRLLPLLLEDHELNQRGVKLLQDVHKQVNKKTATERTADEWFVLGYYAQQVQQYDDAEAHYSQCILKNPDFEAAYKFRAMVCIETRQFEDAEYDLKKAIELDPDYTDARYQMARLLHESDRDKDAAAELQSLLDQDPSYSDAWAMLGSVREKTGDYEQAIEAFQKALELDPENGQYFTQRGLAHYFAGNFPEAKLDLEIAQKITGTNHITQFNLALVLSELDEHVKDAFRNFEKAFKRAPDMLNHFYKQSGKLERERLMSRLTSIVLRSAQPAADSQGGQYYREQLHLLLERKTSEATSQTDL
jgi:tetratricopeptide (TPR) repeat protein